MSLLNFHLYLFLRKLKSKWNDSFIVKSIYTYGAIEVENPKNGNEFKVNGQRLKNVYPYGAIKVFDFAFVLSFVFCVFLG